MAMPAIIPPPRSVSTTGEGSPAATAAACQRVPRLFIELGRTLGRVPGEAADLVGPRKKRWGQSAMVRDGPKWRRDERNPRFGVGHRLRNSSVFDSEMSPRPPNDPSQGAAVRADTSPRRASREDCLSRSRDKRQGKNASAARYQRRHRQSRPEWNWACI